MSKIPVDRYGKTRPVDATRIYTKEPTKLRSSLCLNIQRNPPHPHVKPPPPPGADDMDNDETKEKLFLKSYTSFIPKINYNATKVAEQNPRILDLREKLNEISRKQDGNDRLGANGGGEDSGPYSLLFDLQPDATTSDRFPYTDTFEYNSTQLETKSQYPRRPLNLSSKSMERSPNVVHFDDKPMTEFEYSCEKEPNHAKKTLNAQPRSDLCLQLKSQVHCRNYDTNMSPNDNSLSRTNEENSLDDSLGILTPDQMDDICYLENAFSPTVEGLPIFCENDDLKFSPDNSDTPSTDKTESDSAASTIQNDVYDNVAKRCRSTRENLAPIATIDSIDVANNDDEEILAQNATDLPDEVHRRSFFTGVREPSDLLIKIEDEADKDESNIAEEDFLPSIHGSILEPASSVADTTVNLEIPLDCKHGNPINNRIEQTPSPEDLPLDSSDIHGEISTYSQFSASTLHDSQTYSDSKTDKSIDTSKVSNSFITSITSITSLDGYQGDGEMSRPVSRNADHAAGPREDTSDMDWQNVPVARRVDPMTDSDFFTESDADGIDDHVHRGDRRAQVIDGALYGGKNSAGNPPLVVNRSEDSCMESSGVYTDFENHRASPVFLNVIPDMSPDSTTSTKSECSQRGSGLGKSCFTPIEDALEEQNSDASHAAEEDETSRNTSKRNSLNSVKELKTNDKNKDEKRSFTLKKYKMPKRDVPSKLKAMLASRKPDADSSPQNSPKAVKKTERRDRDFLKKNVLDLKMEYKSKTFKDIKSKVDCSFSLQRSQTSCSVSRMLSSKSTNTNTKPKRGHLRMRCEAGSAVGSGKSSLHSSQSDISAASSPPGKPAARYSALRNGKKRDSGPGASPPARAPPATPAAPAAPQQAHAKKNGVVQKLTSSPVAVRARTSLAPPPSPRKPGPPAATRATPQRPNSLATAKEPARVSSAVGRGKRGQTPQQPAARSPPAPPPAPAPAPPSRDHAQHLAHAAKGVEALGVLVQYLVFQLEEANGSGWRAEAERWRGLAAAERAAAARADTDRAARAQKDFDTIAECLSKISELEREVSAREEARGEAAAAHAAQLAALAGDVRQREDTIAALKEEVAESRARLHAHSELERTLRAQLDAARADLDRARTDLDRARADLDRARADLDRARAAQAEDAGDDASEDSDESTGSDGPGDVFGDSSGDRSDDFGDRSADRSADLSPPRAGSKTRTVSDAACDPVLFEAEGDCDLRLYSKEELSTDPTELAAEVRSLRAVIEMKQAELAAVRGARAEAGAERARRAAAERAAAAARQAAEELRERLAARQSDADRLRDDNRRLRELAARDRDHAARLAAHNEELRYKLRQKSQVVSLLAGARRRSLSGGSARSPSPPPTPPSPASPAASPSPSPGSTPLPAPLPAVKGVVEKHDSVSWVLEIEETPEEMATRLARRSSFRSGGSSSSSGGGGGAGAGGVKRRGGGSAGSSPAPASPAPAASKLFRAELDFPPAPPPLKESAGEAIYIYDDSRY
ncbi:uncharacterized protein LOC121739722 isoform X2 [Aricia agestis]|uniref:uncharacterized protein LOC121739722 isoform X2 n=1 Tax=Aricia agestis TaxID=91739 RepID=UPI001C207629|nr:uncharacterized protein LOC121739722 isoform X2 [Aricia agestis]